jgi:hypothetical protein
VVQLVEALRYKTECREFDSRWCHWHYPSWGRLSLEKKKVPRILPGIKAAGAYGWQSYHFHVPIILNSGNHNYMKPSESEQACMGNTFYLIKSQGMSVNKSVVRIGCESLTISQHSSVLLIMQLGLRQGDSELNQNWFLHLVKHCVKQCS